MGHFLFYSQNQDIRYSLAVLCILVGFLKSHYHQGVILCLVIFTIYFFRNPKIELAHADFTCPSFGRVTNINRGRDTQTVSIFLSVFDPHAQYAPCGGTIEDIEYIPGTFHPAQLYEKTRDNERCVTMFRNRNGESIRVTQIAGFIARRILRFCEKGASVCHGEPFGMIRFGSRVDIEIPLKYTLRVREGDYVSGPNTPLATLDF